VAESDASTGRPGDSEIGVGYRLAAVGREAAEDERLGLLEQLYDPVSRQWSLTFANAASGTLNTPAVGAFEHGRGEFYDQEMLDGRAILVRFVISDITNDACHFEQSFSADGGRTWETNWIAVDTRSGT